MMAKLVRVFQMISIKNLFTRVSVTVIKWPRYECTSKMFTTYKQGSKLHRIEYGIKIIYEFNSNIMPKRK